MFWNTIVSSFFLVAISEMGDKTQLLAFSLSARYKRPWPIMAGILLATILNHGLASSIGALVAEHLSKKTLALILGACFVAFGFWTLIPDKHEDDEQPSKFGAFASTTVLFFLAEMGDKTQLATVALAARFGSALLVTIGTTAGMLVSDGAAVFLGEKLSEHAQMKWIRYTAAGLFFAFGAMSFVAAFQ